MSGRYCGNCGNCGAAATATDPLVTYECAYRRMLTEGVLVLEAAQLADRAATDDDRDEARAMFTTAAFCWRGAEADYRAELDARIAAAEKMLPWTREDTTP